jgi:hypothetical protein
MIQPRVPLPPFNHLRLSTLADVLTCPRCGRVNTSLPVVASLRALPECYNQRCHQRWYAIYLNAGPVEPQLATIFGEDLARSLVALWQLPPTLDRRMYWQLALSARQVQEHGGAGARRLFAAIARFVRIRLALAARESAP